MNSLEKSKPKHVVANKAVEISRHISILSRKTTLKTQYKAVHKINKVIKGMFRGYLKEQIFNEYSNYEEMFGDFHRMICDIKCGILGKSLDFVCSPSAFTFDDMHRFLSKVILTIPNEVSDKKNNFYFLCLVEYMFQDASKTYAVNTITELTKHLLIKRNNANQILEIWQSLLTVDENIL